MVLLSAMQEVQALAAMQGVGLDSDCANRNFAFVSSFPANATTSLHRDLEAGRPSEYDDLVGAVLRLGHAAGLGLPTFVQLDAMIRARGLPCSELLQNAP
jgi:2-dehydropantoate 2-reductase